MRSTEAIRNCFIQIFFLADGDIRHDALSDVRCRFKKHYVFSVYKFLEDDAHRQIVNICDDCIEKFISKIKFQFVGLEQYNNTTAVINQDPQLAFFFRNTTLLGGRIHRAIEKIISVDKMCEVCHLHIVRCLNVEDVCLIDF